MNKFLLNWLVWHRRLGLVTCFGILLWGLSGLSHPIMTRLQPKPTAFISPPQNIALGISLSPAQVLKQHDISKVLRLSLVQMDDETWMRVLTETNLPARYFSIHDGHELTDGDRHYAQRLAVYYSGRSFKEIADSRFVTEFSDDYHAVNRLLPVWRIEFNGDDHLRAFIDTDQARLATLVDDTRFYLTRLFRLGHNWSFVDSSPRLQICVMSLVLSIAIFSACSGLYLSLIRRRHANQYLAKKPLKRWHRRLGLMVALSTLLFAGSGSFHLIMSYKQERVAKPNITPDAILASQLSDPAWLQLGETPIDRLDLVSYQGQPLWIRQSTGKSTLHTQVAMLAQEHHHEHHGNMGHATPPVLLITADGTSKDVPDMLALAQIQASNYAKKPITEITESQLITGFGGEYGFVFKRLPVVKVQFKGAGNPRYYVEPMTGALAAEVKDSDALEGWCFAFLHKWDFANFNKGFRDILVSLFALGNIMVALMGLWLFRKARN